MLRRRPPPGRDGVADGVWYAIGGWVTGFLLSSIVAGVVIGAAGWDTSITHGVGAAVGRTGAKAVTGQPLATDEVPMWAVALFQVPLWVGLAGAPLLFLRADPGAVRSWGLRTVRAADVPLGLLVGVTTQLVLVPLLYLPLYEIVPGLDPEDVSAPARDLVAKATGLGVVVLVVVVVLGAPLVEELFFRGLVLRSLEPRWGTIGALAGSSVLFAATHFQVVQFPALLMFGVVLGVLTQRTGRLAPAVAAHLGFNLTTVLALLVG